MLLHDKNSAGNFYSIVLKTNYLDSLCVKSCIITLELFESTNLDNLKSIYDSITEQQIAEKLVENLYLIIQERSTYSWKYVEKCLQEKVLILDFVSKILFKDSKVLDLTIEEDNSLFCAFNKSIVYILSKTMELNHGYFVHFNDIENLKKMYVGYLTYKDCPDPKGYWNRTIDQIYSEVNKNNNLAKVYYKD